MVVVVVVVGKKIRCSGKFSGFMHHAPQSNHMVETQASCSLICRSIELGRSSRPNRQKVTSHICIWNIGGGELIMTSRIRSGPPLVINYSGCSPTESQQGRLSGPRRPQPRYNNHPGASATTVGGNSRASGLRISFITRILVQSALSRPPLKARVCPNTLVAFYSPSCL